VGEVGIDARDAICSRRTDSGGIPVADVDELPRGPGEVDRSIRVLGVLLVNAEREGGGVTRLHVGVRGSEARASRVNQVTGGAAAVEDDRHAVDWTGAGACWAGRRRWGSTCCPVSRCRTDCCVVSSVPDVDHRLVAVSLKTDNESTADSWFRKRSGRVGGVFTAPRVVESLGRRRAYPGLVGEYDLEVVVGGAAGTQRRDRWLFPGKYGG